MVMAQVAATSIFPLEGNRCLACGFFPLTINPEGFEVCPACGVMDDTPRFVVSDPLIRGGGGGVMQSHQPLHPLGTRIGKGMEREMVPEALLFAEKITPSYRDYVFHRAHFEIACIMERFGLDLTSSLMTWCDTAFRRAYVHAPPRTKARNISLLSLVVVVRVANISHSRVPAYLPFGKTIADFRDVWRACLSHLPIPDLLARVNKILKNISAPPRVCKAARKLVLQHCQVGHPQTLAAALVLLACRSTGILKSSLPNYVLAGHAGIATSALIRRYDRLCGTNASLRQLAHRQMRKYVGSETMLQPEIIGTTTTMSPPRHRGRTSRDPGRGDRIHADLLCHPEGSTVQQVAERCQIKIATAYVDLNKLLATGRVIMTKGQHKHSPNTWRAVVPGEACGATASLPAVVTTGPDQPAWDTLTASLVAAGTLAASLAQARQFAQVTQLGKVIMEISTLLNMKDGKKVT